HDLGLAAVILAELLPLSAVQNTQGGNLWEHTIRLLELLGPDVTFPLSFAGLLHAIGRRPASEICLRLKLSNEERERIEWLVENHAYLCDARHKRTSKLKVILAHPGIRELLALHRADALAGGRSTDHVEYCEERLCDWTEADLNPPPL